MLYVVRLARARPFTVPWPISGGDHFERLTAHSYLVAAGRAAVLLCSLRVNCHYVNCHYVLLLTILS